MASCSRHWGEQTKRFDRPVDDLFIENFDVQSRSKCLNTNLCVLPANVRAGLERCRDNRDACPHHEIGNISFANYRRRLVAEGAGGPCGQCRVNARAVVHDVSAVWIIPRVGSQYLGSHGEPADPIRRYHDGNRRQARDRSSGRGRS